MKNNLLPVESVVSNILYIRSQKVLLNSYLAKLYGVSTKRLNEQVSRNIKRFPGDFMFQLSKEEYNALRYQFGTLKRGQHSKYLPYAFTELGVAMLSSVLNSDEAIEINIIIMRAFVKLRELISSNKKIQGKLNKIVTRLDEHDNEIANIMEIINQMLTPPAKPLKEIGFRVKEKRISYN